MVIGVTGRFASGKSLVASELAHLFGGEFIDADEVVHALYNCGNEGWKIVRDLFGEEIAKDGACVDREGLGDLVFKNKSKLLELEGKIHPLVLSKIEDRVSKGGDFIIEAFDFDKSGLRRLVDYLIFVDADREIILKNSVDRGVSISRVDEILSFQLSALNRDFEIVNKGNVDDLKKKVGELFELIGK